MKQILKYKLVALLLALTLLGSAQDGIIETTFRSNGQDTSYIRSFHEKLILKTYFVNKSNQFSITDIKDEQTTEFKPNDVTNLGFGVNYKAFGLSVAFIPVGRQDRERYGRTRKLDLQGNMYTRKFGFDVRFQYYKGFYIDNPGTFAPDLDQDSLIIKRSDISTLSLGGNIFYVFNNNQFSFKNSFTNNEWQKKSAGSFYAGNSFSIFGLNGDTIIAPTTIVDTLNPKKYFKSMDIISIGGFGGYAYTYVLAKHFFITLAMAPGFATVKIKTQNGFGETLTNNSRLAFQFNSRVGLGYNSDKFFGGLSGFWDLSTFNYNSNEGNVNYTTGALRFYFGMRFL